MDFAWPEEYTTFKASIISFAQKELNHDVNERDHSGAFSKANWIKCADFGILGLSVPKKYGGQEEKVDFLRAMLAMEGLGYGCRDNGLSLGLNAQLWTVQVPIDQFGNEEQKRTYLPALTSGSKICCHALTEPEAGSDIYAMQTTAVKVKDGYVLNGKKCLISLAPIADLALIFAYTDKKKGGWGISAFLIDTTSDGFIASPMQHKMGMRTVPIGEIELNDCFVPEENRLGAEGVGLSIMNHSLEYDRCCILSSQLGAMERQLEDAIEFARQRKQFGQPISQFQSVSNRIVDMKLRLETSKLLLYKAAWLKSTGKSALLESAMIKLSIGENFVASSLDALRTYGGKGYLTDFEIERDLRDSIGGVIYAGTSDIQRNVIAKMIGLK